MSGELILLVVGLVLIVAAGLLAAYLTAHRLDRLHIRTDLARASLAGALERRHTVAAAIARDLADRDPETSRRVAHAVAHARARPPGAVAGVDPAPDPDRRRWPDRDEPGADDAPDAERAENALGMLLAGLDIAALPADLVDELEDALDRVAMARRFYNDSVRDTRSLREQAGVRVLRLAGRAPMPDYVELVDPLPPGA